VVPLSKKSGSLEGVEEKVWTTTICNIFSVHHDPLQWREGADPPDVHGLTWTSGNSSKYNRCLKQKIPTKEWKYLGANFFFHAGNLQGKKTV